MQNSILTSIQTFLENSEYQKIIINVSICFGALLIFYIVYKIMSNHSHTSSASTKKTKSTQDYNMLIIKELISKVEQYPNMDFGNILLITGILQTGVSKSGTKFIINPTGIKSKKMFGYIKYVVRDRELSED